MAQLVNCTYERGKRKWQSNRYPNTSTKQMEGYPTSYLDDAHTEILHEQGPRFLFETQFQNRRKLYIKTL